MRKSEAARGANARALRLPAGQVLLVSSLHSTMHIMHLELASRALVRAAKDAEAEEEALSGLVELNGLRALVLFPFT
jgi:hypothetical protein